MRNRATFAFGLLFLFFSIKLFAQAPVITTEPTSRGVIEGQTAAFSVEASGDTLTYEWFKNNVAIGSSNNPVYTTPATILTDNGAEFKVVVTNSYGSDTSLVAKLYVTASGSRVTANQIVAYIFNEKTGDKINDIAGLTPPVDLTIENTSLIDWHNLDGLYIKDNAFIKSTDPSAVTRIVDAIKGSNEMTLEMWVRSIDTVDNSKVISLSQGPGTVDFEVENYLGYNYKVRTTNTNNAGNPGTIDNLPIVPKSRVHIVFTQKDGISKIYRNGIQVASNLIGGNLSNWTDIFGTILNLGMNNGFDQWEGIYYLTSIYNRGLDSVEVVHNYSYGISQYLRPFVIGQPQSAQVTTGDSVVFNCNVISDSTLSYKWQKNGVDISGAINPTYKILSTVPADSGLYRVIVSSVLGVDTSDNALLKVIPPPIIAPSNLTASLSPTIVNRAQLTWQDNSLNELGFIVERKTGDSASVSPFSAIATLGANVTSFVDSTLADTTTYTFRVKAFIALNQSGYTNLASVTTILSTVATPANLTASLSPTIVNRAQLIWQDKSSNELGFVVERKTGDSASVSPFTVLATLGANVTSFVDSTLADTTTYTFRVKAFNSFTQSGYSNLASVTTVLSTLAAPANLTAILSPTIINRAQLTWQDKSSNETGFTIERKIGDSTSVAPFTVVGTRPANSTSFTDSTLADTTTYTFRVKAFNNFIQSGYTNMVSVTTILSTLAAPNNLIVSLSPTLVNRAQLSWQDNSTNESGFIIERKTGDSASVSPFLFIGARTANVTSFIDSTLADTTTYTFRVKAFNSFTQSGFSNLAYVTTVLSTIAAPADLVATLSPTIVNRAQLTWQDKSSNELGYTVERKTGDSASVAPFTALSTLSANATSYTDSTLADTTTYTFRVKAFNSFTQSGYTNLASVTTVLSTLAAPVNLNASLSPTIINRAELTWQDKSSNELGFTVERKTGDSASVSPFTVLATLGANATSFVDSTLADTTIYTFRVKAFNSFIQSGYTNLASVTTVLSTLAAPANLTASLSPTIVNRAQLTWQDKSSNETGFTIERKAGDSASVAPFTVIGTRPANSTSFVDSTLADTTTYTFRVKAFNTFIQSGYTNLASVTTVLSTLATPSNLTVSLSPTIINLAELTWQDKSSNELGFTVERKKGDSASVAPFTVIGTLAVNATSFVDSTLADTTTYTFRVKAFNSFIQSGYTNLASITTTFSSIAAPTNLLAFKSPADSHNVKLTWVDKSANELGFIIERKTGDSLSTNTFSPIGLTSTNITVYEDSTVADSTTYTYRVKAFNLVLGSSNYSNLAQITTPVPVEFVSFIANAANGRVQLDWVTATELNNAGFSIQRSKDNSKFIDLAFIKGKGTTTTQSAYSYSDKSTLSGKYYYRLKQVDFDGSVIYTKSIEVDLGLPKDFALEQNYPNPFNPSTTIRFSLPINGQVNIKLFNALGQEVVNIFNGELNAGIHETNFNASNLASGVYFYMLKVQGVNGSNFTSTKRMILMK